MHIEKDLGSCDVDALLNGSASEAGKVEVGVVGIGSTRGTVLSSGVSTHVFEEGVVVGNHGKSPEVVVLVGLGEVVSVEDGGGSGLVELESQERNNQEKKAEESHQYLIAIVNMNSRNKANNI